MACAPQSDAGLLARVQEHIYSSGFVGEFVLDEGDQQLLPESCNALIDCCESQTKPNTKERDDCEYAFKHAPHAKLAEVCESSLKNHAECAAQASDADAGAASAARGLCCYAVCGHGDGV